MQTVPPVFGAPSFRQSRVGCKTAPTPRLRRVCCDFQRENGVLHLRGAVRSYYLKQAAQELVLDIEGVSIVNNQIRVTPSTPRETTENRG